MSALLPAEFRETDPVEAAGTVEVSVSPASGDLSVRVPIPLTVGRDGLGPTLSLAHTGYDPLSPLPHGWSLEGLSSVDVDTRDGLPRYDGEDRFRLDGQELVPCADAGRLQRFEAGELDVDVFSLRVERGPLRVERWTHREHRRVHWRVRAADGSVRIYGRRSDGESRIADPASPARTFRWLLEAAYDRLGNAMLVRYRPEDLTAVDPSSVEATSFAGASAQRYPISIRYGNAEPLGENDPLDAARWYLETRFDYGAEDDWTLRPDVGVSCRPGFSVRTRRVCRGVEMWHRFPEGRDVDAELVRALELRIEEVDGLSVLRGTRLVGHEGTGRLEAPPSGFEYAPPAFERAFTRRHVAHLPGARFVDLYGEGLAGLLSGENGVVTYARNLGAGRFDAPAPVPSWPGGLAGAVLSDFDGDGNLELVRLSGADAGYYRFDRRARRWEPLRRFARVWSSAEGADVRTADLSGDGRDDVVWFHRDGITWLPNRGADGFGEPVEVRLSAWLLPFTSPALDRFMADMTGDGLVDVVEVRNGSVRYWPNLGRGRFGEPVVLDGAPRLDFEGSFDADRVLLFDVHGTGGGDLVYLRGDGVVVVVENRRGVSFGEPFVLAVGGAIPNGAPIQIVDLDGDGTSTLLVADLTDRMGPRYHALVLGRATGARQVTRVTHPLGAVSDIEWGYSTAHYLRDVESGRGWDTPLPSPKRVVDAIRHHEPVDARARSERFAYHDGHYDPRERAFAVFAVVETFDVDDRDGPTVAEPQVERAFFHTGEADYRPRAWSRTPPVRWPTTARRPGAPSPAPSSTARWPPHVR